MGRIDIEQGNPLAHADPLSEPPFSVRFQLCIGHISTPLFKLIHLISNFYKFIESSYIEQCIKSSNMLLK
jgi:hypothetical protein